ncbi:MAG: SUMF1/EgtB/PvdO family nonheme iron enzyme [Myxococcales bacterium]|nr:SUMF1/EgtB/PvdO family nonheme iron enzyme [Myxococcales bacterium]
MHRSIAPRSLLLLVLPSLACSGPSSHEYDAVDTPQAEPQEVADPPPPAEAPDGEPKPATPEDCGHTTGRNAEGKCETLHTREREHAQQVQLPAGRFVMGDVPRNYDSAIGRHDPRERWPGQPPRYAETKAFWIDVHEVTRSAYAQCVAAGQCTEAVCPTGVDPVEKYSEDAAALVPQTCVTHEQAEAFCRVQGGRLPTEIEWEYAARGPDARMYPWGNDMRDEYTAALLPISGTPGDASYFGVRGMGTSAVEWVAETYEVDAGLASYLSQPFRRKDGPLLAAEAGRGLRWVIKGGKAGVRRDQGQADPRVGFRCVADLPPDEVGLTVPADPPPIPLLRDSGAGLLVFGGVAEAVDRQEAEKLCAVLRVEHEGQVHEGWRLPTLEEISTIRESFRGPGPFWSADGAVEQTFVDQETAEWEPVEASDDAPLMARCIRG